MNYKEFLDRAGKILSEQEQADIPLNNTENIETPPVKNASIIKRGQRSINTNGNTGNSKNSRKLKKRSERRF
ncbi:MAG: hypothetical protein N3A54_00470 [Patescibacteria group bacterium]|nr:hypothetical protein [Patescibacteria group bacterium]